MNFVSMAPLQELDCAKAQLPVPGAALVPDVGQGCGIVYLPKYRPSPYQVKILTESKLENEELLLVYVKIGL
jgi:hypothetical protein